MKIELYNKNNIDELKVIDKNDNLNIFSLCLPFIKNGLLNYINNIDSEMELLVIDDILFPIVISNPNQKVKNSYVCSPNTHYIDYAKRETEMELAKAPIIKNVALILISALKRLFKNRDFEKAVFINNLLLSTNLHIDFDTKILKEMLNFLIKKFPDQAIVYKSVNATYNKNLMLELEKVGYDKIFSRQVYVLEPKKGEHKKRESYQKDVKIKKKSKYIFDSAENIKEEEYPRLQELYEHLYIKKYSFMNPQFNANFIKETIKNPMFTYKVLRKDNKIDAVLAYYLRNNTITTPIVGYDPSISQKEGLYRIAVLQTIEDAEKNGYTLNMSSGVPKYKMYRGAEPSLEYNMVYFKHLPKKQQLPWSIFQKMTKYLILPIMKKYEL